MMKIKTEFLLIASILYFLRIIAELPPWILLFSSLILLSVATIILMLLRKQNAFVPFAYFLFGIGLFLVNSLGEIQITIAWIALYCAICPIVKLLLRIQFPNRNGSNRGEEMYQKFYEPLTTDDERDCIEETRAGEEALQLAHADDLIATLQAQALSPTDRLEINAISETLDVYRGRGLTDGERRTVNDCLGSILKLTAKYRL